MDTIDLDLISKLAYIGTYDDRLLAKAFRADNGSYHISGSLIKASLTAIKKILEELCPPGGGGLADTVDFPHSLRQYCILWGNVGNYSSSH
jgi:hypothetical protein